MVVYGIAGVFESAAGPPCGSSAMDDSQLRVDPGGGDAAQLHALDAVCLALALSTKLHRGIVAVLGAESPSGGMDDMAGVENYEATELKRRRSKEAQTSSERNNGEAHERLFGTFTQQST